MLVKAAWAGITLKEVDISVHYPEPAKRISHFRPFMDNLALTILNTRLTIQGYFADTAQAISYRSKTIHEK